MKNGGILRKIVSLVISSILICNIPVFASNVQFNANRQENRLVSTIGQTDDVVATTYEAATTNAKLNSLKNSFGSIQENIDYLIQNCSSKLTVWVNSHDEYYNGKTITLTKDGVTVRKCQMYSHNGRYEAEFPKLADGAYQVDYSFKTGNGGILHLKTNVTISGQDVLRQLYGDLFQMSMSEIQQACKDGVINDMASVGDTFSDGSYTYTIIGIDQDTPCDESGNPLDRSKYKNVLTVMPMGAAVGKCNGTAIKINYDKTPYPVTASPGTTDWSKSTIRLNTLKEYLNQLPQETQNVIGYVKKSTGHYLKVTDNYKIAENIVTGDKCFILSVKELTGFQESSPIEEYENTFQYQYFSDIAKSDNDRYQIGSWLRSPFTINGCIFINTVTGDIGGSGLVDYGYDPESGYGYTYPIKKPILPVFCIY